jgi:hypothetical protein
MIDLEYKEEVATFSFRGTTERIVIGHDPETDLWVMQYLRPGQENSSDIYDAQAVITEGQSREDILKRTKRFMVGHGQGLMSNLIQSWDHRP